MGSVGILMTGVGWDFEKWGDMGENYITYGRFCDWVGVILLIVLLYLSLLAIISRVSRSCTVGFLWCSRCYITNRTLKTEYLHTTDSKVGRV